MSQNPLCPTLFVTDDRINDDHIRLLSSLPASLTGTRRLCFHRSNDAELHIMLVQGAIDHTYPPHCHTDSDELTVVIRGGMEITAWSDGIKKPPSLIVVGKAFSGDHAVIVRKGIFHMTRPLSAETAYIEVKLGPFDPAALQRL